MNRALSHSDLFHMNAAEGWLMLNSPEEANAELDHVSPEGQYHANVLTLRWQIYTALRFWEAAWLMAQALCEMAPDCAEAWICQANSMRYHKGVQEARDLLAAVADRFPDDAIIPYNIGCYAAQLGGYDEACGWLLRAFRTDNSLQLKRAALNDADLKPLWDHIGEPTLASINFQLMA
jgi:tetratricopeptide (TPR) repeat protein